MAFFQISRLPPRFLVNLKIARNTLRTNVYSRFPDFRGFQISGNLAQIHAAALQIDARIETVLRDKIHGSSSS